MVVELYAETYAEQFAKLDRPFWNYEDGCVLTALQALYEATGDDKYKKAVQSFLNRCIADDGTIRAYSEDEYSLDKIPSGRGLVFLYKETGNEKYRMAAAHLMNQLMKQPRTDTGSFWHKKIYPYQLWLDGLYMALPFYLSYENEFGNNRHYNDIIQQFRNARNVLFDEEKKLYYHAWDEKKIQFWADKTTGRSPNFWSRAMGWFLMSLADCYEICPESQSEHKAYLKELWLEATAGLLTYADKDTGMLWQLTELKDEPGNYQETSSSAMVAYAIFKGVRLGVFSDVHLKKAMILWGNIETKKIRISDGVIHIDGICAGAGLGPENRPSRDGSIAYYLSEPVVSDEQKGVAAVLMAYSEWLKLRNNLKQATDLTGLLPVQLNDVHRLRHGGR